MSAARKYWRADYAAIAEHGRHTLHDLRQVKHDDWFEHSKHALAVQKGHLRYGLHCSADNAGELCEAEADRPVNLAVLALLSGHKDRHPTTAILCASQPQHSLHHVGLSGLEHSCRTVQICIICVTDLSSLLHNRSRCYTDEGGRCGGRLVAQN